VMQVVPILHTLIHSISTLRVFIAKDLKTNENRNSALKTLIEVKKKFSDGIPLLDPIEDMRIDDPNFVKLIRKVENLEDKFFSNQIYKKGKQENPDYLLFCDKMKLEDEISFIKKQLKQTEEIILKAELKAMKRVLRRLGYTNSEDIIEIKGRVACEINAGDELVVSELIFAGVFNDLSIEQTCALLSCFVFQEKVDGNIKLRDELATPYQQLQETAKRIITISQECKLPLDPEEYLQRFSPHLMQVVYAWAKGATFLEICAMTDIFEGSIIRCMRRLEELLRQLAAASKAIGNSELENKFSDGIAKIKRGVIFAASLYL